MDYWPCDAPSDLFEVGSHVMAAGELQTGLPDFSLLTRFYGRLFLFIFPCFLAFVLGLVLVVVLASVLDTDQLITGRNFCGASFDHITSFAEQGCLGFFLLTRFLWRII